MLQIVPRLQEKASFYKNFRGSMPPTPRESGAFGAGWPQRGQIIILELAPQYILASYAYMLPDLMIYNKWLHLHENGQANSDMKV